MRALFWTPYHPKPLLMSKQISTRTTISRVNVKFWRSKDLCYKIATVWALMKSNKIPSSTCYYWTVLVVKMPYLLGNVIKTERVMLIKQLAPMKEMNFRTHTRSHMWWRKMMVTSFGMIKMMFPWNRWKVKKRIVKTMIRMKLEMQKY